MAEDAFNTHWKELVPYGLHITVDKTRVAGWYKSSTTIGHDQKLLDRCDPSFNERYI
jgi:hypothetical protein